MRQKYANRAIDVIVTSASAPLDFLLKYRGDLFPHTPIVFAATGPPAPAQLASEAGATGIVYVSSYRKTLDLALKLHPDTKHVFIVSGSPSPGESFETMARKDLQGLKKRRKNYLPYRPPARRIEGRTQNSYRNGPSFSMYGNGRGIKKVSSWNPRKSSL